MKWKVSSEKFKDVLLFNPSVNYDFRGEIFTTYKAGVYEKILGQVYLESPFVEDKISISRQGVLRGLHGVREEHLFVTWNICHGQNLCHRESRSFYKW